MRNLNERMVFLLEQARDKLIKKEKHFICFAIDEVLWDLFLSDPSKPAPSTFLNMLDARDVIKEYIKKCLGDEASYEDWVYNKGYPAYDDKYADSVERARLAWIDDMIDKASKGLL